MKSYSLDINYLTHNFPNFNGWNSEKLRKCSLEPNVDLFLKVFQNDEILFLNEIILNFSLFFRIEIRSNWNHLQFFAFKMKRTSSEAGNSTHHNPSKKHAAGQGNDNIFFITFSSIPVSINFYFKNYYEYTLFTSKNVTFLLYSLHWFMFRSFSPNETGRSIFDWTSIGQLPCFKYNTVPCTEIRLWSVLYT